VEQKIDACSGFTEVFIELKQIDSARKYLDLAFTYLDQWNNKEADSEADIYRMQGALYSEEGKFAAAEKSYETAIKLMGDSDEQRRRECGKIYTEAGVMFLAQKNKEQEALKKFQHALNCFIPEFKSDNVALTPDSLLLYDENGLFESCEGKGMRMQACLYRTGKPGISTTSCIKLSCCQNSTRQERSLYCE
jgi:tetratricopeptide (TPR) repeat protein